MDASKPVSASSEFRRATTQRALKSVYRDHISGRAARGRDGLRPAEFELNLKPETKIISRRLRAGEYRFTPFRQLLVLKGADKPPRVLSIPGVRDRIVLKALAGVLASTFEVKTVEPPAWKVARMREAISSPGYEAFVRLDIEGFYPSIPHEILRSKLNRRIKKPDLVELVLAACRTPSLPFGASRASGISSTVGVPQGLSISNVLAEIVMQDLDAEFAAMQTVSYFRYVDDILVLCSANDRDKVDRRLRSALESLELKAHPLGDGSKSKLGLTSETFDFLGFVFTGQRVTARASTVRGLERNIAKTFTAYRYALKGFPRGGLSDHEWPERCRTILSWRLNLLVTGCILDGTRRGWVHYFSQINDVGLLRRLDHQVARHLARCGLTEAIDPKSFRRAYWAITRPNSRRRDYVPDFDATGVAELRRVLVEVFFQRPAHVSTLDELDLRALFTSKMQRVLEEIEVDVGALS